MGMIKEFKEFALRGSVIDLAVAFIIGSAFNKVVTSVVEHLIMPPIGVLMGGVNFSDKFIILDPLNKLANREAITSLAKAKEAGAAVIAYGQFINVLIDFIIVAFCVFLIVKAMNTLKKKPAPAPAVPPEPSAQEKLLMEIRDVLKNRG